jgi:uncharacterized protein (TIGR03790 family)
VKFSSVLGIILALASVAVAEDNLARRVLVVYNATEPESKALAEYYAQRRGVPTNQLCGLHVRNVDLIPRHEFNGQIRDPILKFMLDHGLLFQLPEANRVETFDNKIDYLVLIYGIPLRIDDDASLQEPVPTGVPVLAQRNHASVDSELTTLPTSGTRRIGWLANPFFNSPTTRFGPPLNNAMMLVARLDGPDPKTVRRMIDDALATERTGLLGRAYFDALGSPPSDGYAEGDAWIKTAARYVRDAGFETVLDDKPALFGVDFPMTDAAIYTGWYAESVTGVFTRADFKFKPGAVAYHLHSWSASSLRNANHLWVGPLLARGAAVSFGNVFEPFLSVTPHVDLFFKCLLAGATFAEAGWYSQPALSWQTTFVGDPLYRPFALSIEAQIARLEAEKNPAVAWAYLRQVNVLAAAGQPAAAVKLCRDKAATLSSAVLYEKLGDLLADSHREKEAAEAYLQALAGAEPLRQQVIGDKIGTLPPAAKKK